MPVPLRKVHEGLNLEEAQEQARQAIRRCVALCEGRQAFTDKLNELLRANGQKPITRQAVQWWESEGTFVHEQFWPHIEQITGLRVTRVHLRPDVYGIGGWRIDEA